MCFGDGRGLTRDVRKIEQQLPPDKRQILDRIHEFLDSNEDQWKKFLVFMVRQNAILLLHYQAPSPDQYAEYRDWVREMRSAAKIQQFMIDLQSGRLEEAVKTSVLLEKAWEAWRMGREGADIDLKDVRVTGMERVKHLFRRMSKEDQDMLFELMLYTRRAHRMAGGNAL